MSPAPYLPPIPRPPHDPTSLLLNERLGWTVLESDKVVAGHLLHLERFPGSLRWLTEPSGSFGGLRTPSNVALDDCSVWLLDQEPPLPAVPDDCVPDTAPIGQAVLKRFDPCECRFDVVACFGEGLRNPTALAWCGDRLFVSDTGNGRVCVFLRPTLPLSAVWTAPTTWQPMGIVVDHRGTVYVADPLNGAIHRFSRHGHYLGAWPGFGASKHLAMDRQGTIYAAGDLEAFRVGEGGVPIPLTDPADDLKSGFPSLPFEVDAAGNLHLGPLCLPPSEAVFDPHGNPIVLAPLPAVQRYERVGTVVIGPLDSLIDNCLWHRVILRGSLPDGGRVEVATFTSHVELPRSEIDLLPSYSWETNQQAFEMPSGQWDCLVRSPKARFLWLRLTLRGDGKTTPMLRNVEVEFPRISLRRFMPAVYGSEPVSADFTDRLLSIVDRRLRDTEHQVDTLAKIFDPMATPMLDWLASWVGLTLDRQLPEETSRRLLKNFGSLNAIRGTRYGLWRQLLVYLGFDALTTTCQCDQLPCTCRKTPVTCPPTPPHVWRWTEPPLILEHYKLRRWLDLGRSRLGDQAVLWGKSIVNRSQIGSNAQVGVTQLKVSQDPLRDPFHVYAHKFTVFVPACAGNTPGKRRLLENLIQREAPAHTLGEIRYVEARFRIGVQSTIGLDSVVGRAPEGIRLGETPIGPASVLSGSGEPTLGTTTIGSTTTLQG
jgi:phage tail-like protein